MVEPRRPTMAHGKICCLEIPARDLDESVAFYASVFDRRVRCRGDGSLAFDDGVGEVSGTWVVGRAPLPHPGLLVYVLLDDIAASVEAVVRHGGRIVQPVGADAPELTARFAYPAGNVPGLYRTPA